MRWEHRSGLPEHPLRAAILCMITTIASRGPFRSCIKPHCTAPQGHFPGRSHRFSTTDLAAGPHACRTPPESSTLNESIVLLITRSRVHTGKKTRDSPARARNRRRLARTDRSWKRRKPDRCRGRRSMDRVQIFFAIAVAEAIAGDGASCTGAQIFFAITVADRPAPAWAIIYLDALYDLW